jgi:hypothetical protein
MRRSQRNFLKHGGTEDTECFVHALISLLTQCLCVLIRTAAVHCNLTIIV